MKKCFAVILALSLVGSAHSFAFAEKKATVTIPGDASSYEIVDKEGNSVKLQFTYQPEEIIVVVTVPDVPKDPEVIKIPLNKKGGEKDSGGDKAGSGSTGGLGSDSIKVTMPVFKDIVDHWARDDIQFMAALGLLKGYPDGTFKPEKSISKAEFAALLSRAIQLSEKDKYDQPVSLQDVTPRDWFYSYVQYLEGRGNIVPSKMYPQRKLYANHPIYREEVAVWMAKEVEQPPREKLPVFADVSKMLYPEEVNKVSGAGLIKGYPDGTFRPFNNTTRAQAATMVLRLLQLKGMVKEERSETRG
ncbi:S-layer homology domain-containing protein [Brevibacillus brevis]|uniref:S-layer homology domain-containing protein n=1 Tax=Brevibacillus brevis TaxID=1393 RepID=A0ABY9T5P7_BREBE|nr:S-layer homology domain-containing protein [Brevibacillus brevis]WNC15405.1 S-layer homology domain-containing protein [Brevibacillus brevis]